MSDVFRVRPDDPKYQRMARAEARWWDNNPGWADATDAMLDDVSTQHYNRRFTGDEHVRWFETISNYGNFSRGLILGAAGLTREARILELNPSLDVTLMDISPGAVAKRERSLSPMFPGRVRTAVADFNFIELPPRQYDLIVSSAVLHHIINLEHLAAQIERSLTPGGYLFVEDYVGETKIRFRPEKKLAYELTYDREMTRQGRNPATLEWVNDESLLSPFCCIRSSAVIPVLRQHLDEVELRTVGALAFLLCFARDNRRPDSPSLRWRILAQKNLVGRAARFANRRLSSPDKNRGFFPPEFMRRLHDVGDRLSDDGAILPTNAFAIYRKPIGR